MTASHPRPGFTDEHDLPSDKSVYPVAVALSPPAQHKKTQAIRGCKEQITPNVPSHHDMIITAEKVDAEFTQHAQMHLTTSQIVKPDTGEIDLPSVTLFVRQLDSSPTIAVSGDHNYSRIVKVSIGNDC